MLQTRTETTFALLRQKQLPTQSSFFPTFKTPGFWIGIFCIVLLNSTEIIIKIKIIKELYSFRKAGHALHLSFRQDFLIKGNILEAEAAAARWALLLEKAAWAWAEVDYKWREVEGTFYIQQFHSFWQMFGFPWKITNQEISENERNLFLLREERITKRNIWDF